MNDGGQVSVSDALNAACAEFEYLKDRQSFSIVDRERWAALRRIMREALANCAPSESAAQGDES